MALITQKLTVQKSEERLIHETKVLIMSTGLSVSQTLH